MPIYENGHKNVLAICLDLVLDVGIVLYDIQGYGGC